MQYVSYLLFRFFAFLCSLLPFPILHLISDFVSFIFHRVIRYRKTVILKNLNYAFPDWDEKQIKKLLPKIYQHTTDLIFESLKGVHLSKEKTIERFQAKVPDSMFEYFDKGVDIICFAAHYGNWEWGGSSTTVIPHKHIVLYKPLKNKYINDLLKKTREQHGGILSNIYTAKSELNKIYKVPKAVSFISDQNPTNMDKAHDVLFFGKKAKALHGASEFTFEKKLPAYFYAVTKLGRSNYFLEPILFYDGQQDLSAAEINQLYFNELEKHIKKQPEYWLWSHKRWKSEIAY